MAPNVALEDSDFGNVSSRYQGRSKVLIDPEHNLKFAEKIASIALNRGKVGSFLNSFRLNFLLFWTSISHHFLTFLGHIFLILCT